MIDQNGRFVLSSSDGPSLCGGRAVAPIPSGGLWGMRVEASRLKCEPFEGERFEWDDGWTSILIDVHDLLNSHDNKLLRACDTYLCNMYMCIMYLHYNYASTQSQTHEDSHTISTRMRQNRMPKSAMSAKICGSKQTEPKWQ